MKLASMFLGAGLFTAASTGVYADSLSSRVLEWNPVDQIITLADGTQMLLAEDLAPADLQRGDEVTVLFGSGEEEGMDEIYEIKILQPTYEGEDDD